MTSRQSVEFSLLHTTLLKAIFTKSTTTTHAPSTCAWPACGNRLGPPKRARIIERLPDLQHYTTTDNRGCFAYALHRLRNLMVCARHDGMAEKAGMPEEWIGDDDAAWVAVMDVLSSNSAHGHDKGRLVAGKKRTRGEEEVNVGQNTPSSWSGYNTQSGPTLYDPWMTPSNMTPSSSWSSTTNATPPTPLSAASRPTFDCRSFAGIANIPAPNIESTDHTQPQNFTNLTFADRTSAASQVSDDFGIPALGSAVCIVCTANCDWVDDEGWCLNCFFGAGSVEGRDGE
ncbi:hypothetical protein BST61_g11456 [Cercospora zeina]